jgi:hypothetical protein
LRDDLVTEAFSFQQMVTPLPLMRSKTISFSGGTDHMVTSDPAVGIPSPTLVQWPASFYHTTADAMEMVDEKSLWTAGVLTGSYLMWLANAGREEALWLGWEMLHRYEADLAVFAGDALARMVALAPEAKARAWHDLYAGVIFRQDRMSAALESLLRLAPVEDELLALVGDMNELTDGLLDRARHQTRPRTLPRLDPHPDDWTLRADALFPKRLYRGPIMDMGSPHQLFEFDETDLEIWQGLYRQVPGWRLVRVFAEYWADGQRSLAEIARLVALESGQHVGPAIEAWFRLLEKAGLMTMQ